MSVGRVLFLLDMNGIIPPFLAVVLVTSFSIVATASDVRGEFADIHNHKKANS